MKYILMIMLLSSSASSKDSFRIPNKSLLNTKGEEVSIFELNKNGVTLFLNFWAEWCASCKKEIPELNKIKQKYSKRSDIRFIGINGGDKDRKIKKFLKKYPFHFEILKDKDKVFSKGFGVKSLPQTFIIKNGKIVFHKFVPPTEAELQLLLDR